MRRTKAEAAETRCAVLTAAEKLFFEKGVANSTLDEIASAAGVTRGAVYWHFDSKSDLFLQLYNAAQLPRVNMSDAAGSGCEDTDPLLLVETIALDWFEMLANDVQRQRLLTILLRTNFEGEFVPVLRELETLDDEHIKNMERIFAKAEDKGQLSPPWNPAACSRAVKWQMKGICWEWLLFGRKFDLVALGGDNVRKLFATFRRQS
jgi:TetR/AcrR family acrAB operon transcriptional repressor